MITKKLSNYNNFDGFAISSLIQSEIVIVITPLRDKVVQRG